MTARSLFVSILLGVITLCSLCEAYNVDMDSISHRNRMLLQAGTTATVRATNKTNSTNITSSSITTTTTTTTTSDPPLWQSIWTVLVVLFMFIVLATELFQPECVMLAALTVLMCSGFLPTANALIGFSNEGMLTVLALMAFAQGLESAGALELLRYLLEIGTNAKTSIQFVLLRLTVISGTISAFLNNTPVVAFFIPVLQEFCQKYGFSTAEVMLPLSYAVILGGTITTIGTSTNLVATGLYATKLNTVQKTTKWNANNVLGLFEMGKIGLPVMLAGIVYIILVSPLLFKGRRVKQWSPEHIKDYCLQMHISKGCTLIGKQLGKTSIFSMGATLISHIRAHTNGALEKIANHIAQDLETGLNGPEDQHHDKKYGTHNAPNPDDILQEGDVLIFRAELHQLPELLRFDNLNFAVLKDGEFGIFGQKKWYSLIYLDDRRLVEASIGLDSPAAGLTTDDKFREKYNALVVAVHRHGKPLLSYHDVVVQPGDSVLVLTNDSFITKFSRDSTFSLVKLVATYKQKRHPLAPLCGTIALILMIVLSQVLNETKYGNISILKTALCGMIFMAITGSASQVEMRNGAKMDLLIMISVGFGLSEALTISGGAKMVASWIVNAAAGNPGGLVAGTYFVVVLFNAAVTNNAAVSIFFPIAWEIAQQSKMDFYPLLLTLMFAGSADFSTPYGYQCNLMVYAPGGYTFSDYLKFGIPLQIISGIFTCTIVFSLDYWWIYTVVLAITALVIVGIFFFMGGHEDDSRSVEIEAELKSKGDMVYSKGIDDSDPVIGQSGGNAVPSSESGKVVASKNADIELEVR